jgi:hypothetical protein
MYVVMYISMYVCMYVCMCVCTWYEWMDTVCINFSLVLYQPDDSSL